MVYPKITTRKTAIKTAIGTKTAIKVAMEAAMHHGYRTKISTLISPFPTGFGVIPHISCHTYITNLLLAGVDIKTVQYLAGHERAKITLDIYAHLTYNRPEEILEKVNAAFGEG